MPDAEEREPDPNGWIPSDDEGLALVDATVEPSGGGHQVTLTLRPNPEIAAHWNNEAGPTQLWLDPPEGWTVARRLHTVPNPDEAISEERRTFTFEVERSAGTGSVTLAGYAVYFVCEGDSGVCMSRRQTIEVPLRL